MGIIESRASAAGQESHLPTIELRQIDGKAADWGERGGRGVVRCPRSRVDSEDGGRGERKVKSLVKVAWVPSYLCRSGQYGGHWTGPEMSGEEARAREA